jgi:uncharacterized protein
VKIDLSDIENQARHFDETLELQPENLDVEQIQEAVQVRLEANVSRTPLGFSFGGTCHVNGALSCSRCLESIAWSHSEDFSFLAQNMENAPKQDEVGLEEADLDVVFIKDSTFDLADLATEQVLLSLPMRVVCSEECQGLCPSCGCNYNIEGACSCEPEIDPRWDGLRNITGR